MIDRIGNGEDNREGGEYLSLVLFGRREKRDEEKIIIY